LLPPPPLTPLPSLPLISCPFFFTHPPPPEIYPLSLHDALPISAELRLGGRGHAPFPPALPTPAARATFRSPGRRLHPCRASPPRSEEHTSELQSLANLVCRLLLEKKKKIKDNVITND